MDGFTGYKLYLAIKTHFNNQSYDVFKHNGKLKSATAKQYIQRKDRGLIDSLSARFKTEKEFILFVASNFMYRNDQFLYSSYDDAKKNYMEFIKRKQSLSYIVESDFLTISNLSVINNENIMKLYVVDKITIETMIILDNIIEICNGVFNDFLKEDVQRIKKSAGFIKFDKERFTTLYGQIYRKQNDKFEAARRKNVKRIKSKNTQATQSNAIYAGYTQEKE